LNSSLASFRPGYTGGDGVITGGARKGGGDSDLLLLSFPLELLTTCFFLLHEPNKQLPPFIFFFIVLPRFAITSTYPQQLIPAKPKVVQRGQKGTHTIASLGRLRLTLHHRRRAFLSRARSTRGADRRRGALHLGAPGPRARGALALGLVTLGAIQNHRLGLGDRRLEHVVAEVRDRGHFAFQNIVIQIRTGRAPRHSGFQDILGQIWFSARRTVSTGQRISTAAGTGLLTRIA